ncbi:hypothetical protein [Natrinema pallidum]|uniref:Uncharacterized protein n=2 Tax=Natrinema pallidum TaxID=69527 RepID=L9Z0S9_9EURY|nr:hypothetical protein [Natrinema pallidum]ELY79312.1 hypothetical protein C487_06373 [Natrinema pallidum DSM 3751]QCW04720.1 hypothetical protein FGF80_16485 [Natrinema pallidum]
MKISDQEPRVRTSLEIGAGLALLTKWVVAVFLAYYLYSTGLETIGVLGGITITIMTVRWLYVYWPPWKRPDEWMDTTSDQ